MIVGIDLGGMSAKAAVIKDGEAVGKTKVETSASFTPEQTALSLVRIAMESAEKSGVGFENVQAIGIGSPGVVDSQRGVVVHWSNFGWKNVELAKAVSQYSGKKVFVTNDANAAALGESRYGAGKAFRDSILVTLGTGIGGGIILDGKLFEGYMSAGAEIGHMVIRENGELCTCGRHGCFERYASVTGLIRMTCSEMQANPNSALWSVAPELSQVDGKTVFAALERGDASAKKVLLKYIASLGEGIANLINLFRPQAIIIGGGISAEGERLLQPLREYVYPRMYVSETYAPFDIVMAQLGNDAGLYGAAAYAFERL